MVNMSFELENSIRYCFQVVLTSGELGNFHASPFAPLGVPDLMDTMIAVYFSKICLKLQHILDKEP